MTEAIAAITSSTSPNHEQISPNDLADFESAYEGEDIQFSSINSVDETETIDFSERLFQHVMEIDDGYHHLFSNKLNAVPKINITSESIALQNGNTEPEHFDFSSPSTDNLQQMMNSLSESYVLGRDAMAWSLRVNLFITTATSMSKGLGSLLKG